MLPAIYAHRLGSAYGPDSSGAALSRTLAGPVDGFEADCCLTADGDLVLLHDPLLSAGTTLCGWAHERRARDICAGRLLHRDGTASDEPPLRLDELLDRTGPGHVLQLEVKAHADPALARRTARAVCDHLRDHPARERAEITSFWPEACVVAARMGFRARLVIIAAYRIPGLVGFARRAGLVGVGVEPFLLTASMVARVRAAGLSVTGGTVNHAPLMEALLPLHLDAVGSDAPHELRESLTAAAPLALAA